jgi:hypothetical protein
MSLTSIEVVNVLYQHIKNSVLFSDAKKPNGELKKYQRPANSQKEDVVINGLPNNREVVQEGVLNINIFVKNLDPTQIPSLNGDTSQPDTGRLLYLSKLANQALGSGNEVWNTDGSWCFKLQQDYTEPDEGTNQHYINIRIEFYSIN